MHHRQPRHILQQPRDNQRHRLVEHLRPIAPRRHQQPRRRAHRLRSGNAKISGRTGTPVTSAFRKYFVVCAKFTAAASHPLSHQPIRQPRHRIRLIRHRRNPQAAAAAIIAGPLAYPPTPTTTSGLNSRSNDTHRITPTGRSINVRSARPQTHILQLPRPHQFQLETPHPAPASSQFPELSPDEPHLGPMHIPQLPPNRQRRNHMPASPPTSNHHSQRIVFSLGPGP